MKKLMVAVLVACLTAAFTVRAAESDIVAEVRVENIGAGQIDKAFFIAHTTIRKGMRLGPGDAGKDVRTLLDSGRFADAEVSVDSRADGMYVTYRLKNKLKLVAPVAVKGSDYFSESKVRSFLGIGAGDFVDDQVMAVGANKVIQEYRDRHFPDVAVNCEITVTDKAEGLAKATVTVEEGGRAKLKQVLFKGNSNIDSTTLRRIVTEKAWWNPFSWFGSKRYDADDLDLARSDIDDLYRARGFLDVKVRDAVVERGDDGRLTVTFNIVEGPRYRVGKIGIKGVTIFPESELKRLVQLKTGDIVSPFLLDRNAMALQDYYGTRGYIHAMADPVITPVTPAGAGSNEMVADVTFVFVEGRQIKLGNIRIHGNVRTRDKVIRRELLVYPGEIFDEVKVRTSKNRLMNLGYFGDVRTMPLGTDDPFVEDLLIEVAEKQTGQFTAGVGFSSVDDIFGYVGISQQNFDIFGWPYFTGAGQKAKFYAQMSESTRDFELSFVEPWFMDRKLEFGVTLYKKSADYSEYDIDRTGGRISLGKALGSHNRIDVDYQLEQVELNDISDTNEYFFVDDPSQSYFFTQEDEKTIDSSLTVTLTHDVRDNPFVPNSGYRTSVYGTLTGGPLGFDTDVYQLGFRTAHYLPLWFGHVLSLRARYDVIEAFGDSDEVPISKRLFIGGGRTLRGFDYRDVGPKVYREVDDGTGNSVVYHRPIGGQSLGMASLEYSIPIVPRTLRFAGFYDIGNVWADPYEFDADNLASSAGVGIRIDLPQFPIRIDRAWVIEKDDELTDEDTWVFWIGPSF